MTARYFIRERIFVGSSPEFVYSEPVFATDDLFEDECQTLVAAVQRLFDDLHRSHRGARKPTPATPNRSRTNREPEPEPDRHASRRARATAHRLRHFTRTRHHGRRAPIARVSRRLEAWRQTTRSLSAARFDPRHRPVFRGRAPTPRLSLLQVRSTRQCARSLGGRHKLPLDDAALELCARLSIDVPYLPVASLGHREEEPVGSTGQKIRCDAKLPEQSPSLTR